MSSKAAAFAQEVLDALVAAGNVTDLDVTLAGGPSSTTMTKFRKVAAGTATMDEPRSDVLKAIDDAAHWKPGSARQLWRHGTTPTVLDASEYQGTRAKHTNFEVAIERVNRRIDDVERRLDSLEFRSAQLASAAEGDDPRAAFRTLALGVKAELEAAEREARATREDGDSRAQPPMRGSRDS